MGDSDEDARHTVEQTCIDQESAASQDSDESSTSKRTLSRALSSTRCPNLCNYPSEGLLTVVHGVGVEERASSLHFAARRQTRSPGTCTASFPGRPGPHYLRHYCEWTQQRNDYFTECESGTRTLLSFQLP